MEYHNDRFDDFSLLIFKDQNLISVLPANRLDDTVISHSGLTYGGFIVSSKAKINDVRSILSSILMFLESEKINFLDVKLSPKIYHTMPSDEIDYLLFILKAKLVSSKMSSTISSQNKIKIQSNRLEGKKKAINQNLVIKEESSFEDFWNTILVPNLKHKFNASPVHDLQEITRLKDRFPSHIRQFNVYKEDSIVAGATIFETKNVAHTQYISANSDKQQLGSLDFLFEHLIENVFDKKPYFDFGTSNENDDQHINSGLMYWKESFGARGISCQTFKIDVGNHTLLNSIML